MNAFLQRPGRCLIDLRLRQQSPWILEMATGPILFWGKKCAKVWLGHSSGRLEQALLTALPVPFKAYAIEILLVINYHVLHRAQTDLLVSAICNWEKKCRIAYMHTETGCCAGDLSRGGRHLSPHGSACQDAAEILGPVRGLV